MPRSRVRQLFGYSRFDQPPLVAAMNDIYTIYTNEFRLLANFFSPTMNLTSKTRVGAAGFPVGSNMTQKRA